MICCGFGHRFILDNISKQVEAAIAYATERGCTTFYTGAMGEFDSLFSCAVRRAKKAHPQLKLICVKPYMTNDVNMNRDYYAAMYDDVIVPDELAGVHYKAAIKARNRWIINKSDLVIGYTIRNDGGAYTALCYARRLGKEIVDIGKNSKL